MLLNPGIRVLTAEFVGALGLLAAVVGSGVMATNLTEDVALQLLVNALATVAALGVLIATLGPVSGAHFNPAVSVAVAARGDLAWAHVPAYAAAQVAGALAGTALANLMFGLPAWHLSGTERTGAGLWLGEVVATAGLIMVVGFVSQPGRGDRAPLLVPAWILAAYFFTSSTSFANPAVTLGRAFTDTFSGIQPGSVPGFLVAQAVGTAVGLAAIALVVPSTTSAAPSTHASPAHVPPARRRPAPTREARHDPQ
ncbi:MAG TPA: aquaporin [Pedococcus sp.]|uniref:aquaporin n=1 Tax=Pedococcus sp. TaxID=2860345 RepID=UPI002F928BE6